MLPNGTACAAAGPGGICCSGTCVDNISDNANCGGCGIACATGETCIQETQNALPYGTCQIGCGASDCPTGTACSNGSCTPLSCTGLYDGTHCSALDGGGLCCGGACVGLDTANCGACGFACPSGFTCVNGNDCAQGANQEPCAAGCPAGTACLTNACAPIACTGLTDGDVCAAGPNLQGTCCSGICAATSEDPANCGGCGLTCSGVCQVGQCLADLPQACLASCPQGTLCVNGACVGSICSGQSSCLAEDGAAGQCCGLACADLATDTQNCGACGIACTSGACSGGKCPGVRCSAANQGVFCETGEATDICCGTACIDSATDPNNCGGCGVTCGLGACDAGSCVP